MTTEETGAVLLTPSTEMATAALMPDPGNRATFDPLEGEEFAKLVQSIRERGLINPIAVTPDGRIIAGEQRWRAAQAASLSSVPVRVFDADEQTVELLRLEENLCRRTLKTSEAARAVKRWYELHGVQREGNRRSHLPEVNAKQLAAQMNVSTKTVTTYRTLADLIPPLAALLDEGKITTIAAYQLAQLTPDLQQLISEELTVEQMRNATAMKELKDNLADLNAEIERLARALDEADATEVRRQKDREIADLRETAAHEIASIQHAAAEQIAMLRQQREDVQEMARKNPVCRWIEAGLDVGNIDPVKAAQRMSPNDYLRDLARHDLAAIPLEIEWLQRYQVALQDMLGERAPGERPTSIKEGRRVRARQTLEESTSHV
jgi:ParB/RepB/Spo0J family partition protein